MDRVLGQQVREATRPGLEGQIGASRGVDHPRQQERLVARRGEARQTGCGILHPCLAKPGEKCAVVDAAGITEVNQRRVVAAQYAKAAGVVTQLAQEQIAVLWRAVSMGVELHVDQLGRK